VVADKNCEKIHFIADNIYCCGAGTAADTEQVTAMVASLLKLHKYATGRQSKVITALTLLKQHLFRYQGHVSAALVLGGFDFNGPHLFTVRFSLLQTRHILASTASCKRAISSTCNSIPLQVFPHGSTDSLPFATMGSGSLNAMAVFEAGYKDDMTQADAEMLVARAIKFGAWW
jgi:20S proteasome subunit beta 2